MHKKKFFGLTCIVILLSLVYFYLAQAAPGSTRQDASLVDHVQMGFAQEDSTPVSAQPSPTATPTPSQPLERQREPGLIAGALLIVIIILIGIIRYSRQK
jgi:hypothetical protein